MMNFLLNPMLFATLTGAMQKKFEPFVNLYNELCEVRAESSVSMLAQSIIASIGYFNYLREYDADYEARGQNVEELVGVISEIEDGLDDEENALGLFLENAALATDMDTDESDTDYVSVMTMHSAKGLEYHTVFIAGMEETLFPTTRSLESEDKLEEERRLCYVGITRARKQLHLINAQSRRLYNRESYNKPSRFLGEIPERLLAGGSKRREYIFEEYGGQYNRNNQYASRAQKYIAASSYSARPAYEPQPCQPQMKPQAVMPAPHPPKPNVNPEALKLEVGMRVNHTKFGDGNVIAKSGSGNSMILTIEFENGEVKKLAAAFAPLKGI